MLAPALTRAGPAFNDNLVIMTHWPAQLAVILGILFFVGRLPGLGSPVEALLASLLAVGTVAAVCALGERLRAEGIITRIQSLTQKADA